MRLIVFGIVASACMAVSLFAGDEPSSTADSAAWSAKSAAGYLDGRMAWWITWKNASRDHETFCVSCHTVLPYAMGRPALSSALGEREPSPNERSLIDNVTKRVRMWNEVAPFYSDEKSGAPKSSESRGTEAILNALVLASYDAGHLGSDMRLALDNMWALQLRTGPAKGAFPWLEFHNSPWEGDSQFYGATLAAIAVGSAPASYQTAPENQERMKSLREYLVRARGSQVLIDRVTLLLASAKVPGLLTRGEQQDIIGEALGKQQADGGFSLSSFVGSWKRHDDTPLETKSDGYATGVVMFALQQAGVSRDQPSMKRGLAWLAQNQNKAEGRWLAYSLNKQRDLESDIGRFMSDAATAYAVLALRPVTP
jgi:squalene-hopene/tetraprenyl-beta-curcumene cyclase